LRVGRPMRAGMIEERNGDVDSYYHAASVRVLLSSRSLRFGPGCVMEFLTFRSLPSGRAWLWVVVYPFRCPSGNEKRPATDSSRVVLLMEAAGIEPASRDHCCDRLYMLICSFVLGLPGEDQHPPGRISRLSLTRRRPAAMSRQSLCTIHQVETSWQIRAA
jgi:hypothetical protein